MTFTKEDLQKIKLPISRETYYCLVFGMTPKWKDWPEDLKKEYDRWVQIRHKEMHLADWQ